MPLDRFKGRIVFSDPPDLSHGIHGTQGVDLRGSIDVQGGRYVGTLTYTYRDTYGFGVEDLPQEYWQYFTGRSLNSLMRHLQLCGSAHWFPVSVTVEVPFDQPAVIPQRLRGSLSTFAVAGEMSEATAAAAGVPVSTAPGFGTQPNIFYRYFVANGVEVSGSVPFGEELRNVVLPPNRTYRAVFYAPSINSSTSIYGMSGPSGSTFQFDGSTSVLSLNDFGGFDSDGDGLPDVGELAIGTLFDSADTDGDGVSDSAEITQGLNPLDNRGFPTGVISNLPLPGTAAAIAVEGDRIYIATGNHGMVIVDGTQFNNPIVLGQIDLPGSATDVGVDPNLQIAAVATGSTLELVDFSDSMMPQVRRSVAVGATHVEVANGLAYATSGTFLRVVDLLTGDVVQTLFLPGSGEVTGLAREGTTLYAYVSGSDTFSVIDIANEGAAAIQGQVNESVASSDVGVFVGNGVAWLAGSGLRTIDVSNPASPTLIHGADNFFTARRIALNGSGLGLLAPDGNNFIQVYDVTNTSDTGNLLTQFPISGGVRDVAVSRGIAYVATDSGLEVVNYRSFDTLRQAPTVTITTSAVDADPSTDGIQVLEGTTIPIGAVVRDDVQVRNVELLVNGQVVRNDVSFPFDFFAVAPNITPGVNSVVLQVRATDTGGNSQSNSLNIGLVPDTFPPTIVSIDPADGTRRFQGQRTVRVRFSEAIAASGVTGDNFQLVAAGPGDVFGDDNDQVLEVALQLRDGDRLLQMTTNPLSAGLYQTRIQRDGIADRVGNPLGTGILVSNFTVVEFEGSAEFLPFGTDIFISQDDVSVAVAPMPFSFEFFGQPVTGPMFVTSNGIVEFEVDTIRGTYTNYGLPSGNEIAAYPFFDDLYPPSGGRIGLFDGDGVRAVTWEDLPYYSDTSRKASFQIAFLSSGTIQVRYGNMDSMPDGSATIGLARGGAVAAPNLGNIANKPDIGITTNAGILDAAGLSTLDELPDNDLLVFTPDGSGNYTIVHNPIRAARASLSLSNLMPNRAEALSAVSPISGSVATSSLSQDSLTPLVEEASSRWVGIGLDGKQASKEVEHDRDSCC